MLLATINSQEEFDALPEALKSEYTKQGDKWELQVQGMKAESAFSDMRDTIGKERNQRKDAEKQLEDKNKEAADLQTKVEDLQAKIDNGTGGDDNFEERAEARFAPQRTRLEKQIADLQTSVNNLTNEKQELVGVQNSTRIREEIATVLTDMKVAPAVIKDAQEIGAANFELDSTTGQVIGKDGSTVSEWAEAAKQTRPHWFGTTAGGGAQGGSSGNHVGNPWTRENWNRENQVKIFKEKGYGEADKLAKAAGLPNMAASHSEIATPTT